MKTKTFLAVGIVLIMVLVGLAGCSAAGVGAADAQPLSVNVGSQQTGIWVSGQGKVTVTPDIAMVYLGVSAKADKVADAQAQASTAMDKIMAALASAGVDIKDIQTQSFSIQQYTNPIPPVTVSPYEPSSGTAIVPMPIAPPTPIEPATGYEVDNTVTVKIRALDKVGSIIDAVATAGGDNTRINGINFSVEDPSKSYSQARELAMNDAKAKADQIAKLSGVNLGKPTYISDNSYIQSPPYPVTMYKSDMAGAAPTVPISPGEMDITMNVQVAYAIQ